MGLMQCWSHRLPSAFRMIRISGQTSGDLSCLPLPGPTSGHVWAPLLFLPRPPLSHKPLLSSHLKRSTSEPHRPGNPVVQVSDQTSNISTSEGPPAHGLERGLWPDLHTRHRTGNSVCRTRRLFTVRLPHLRTSRGQRCCSPLFNAACPDPAHRRPSEWRAKVHT